MEKHVVSSVLKKTSAAEVSGRPGKPSLKRVANYPAPAKYLLRKSERIKTPA